MYIQLRKIKQIPKKFNVLKNAAKLKKFQRKLPPDKNMHQKKSSHEIFNRNQLQVHE